MSTVASMPLALLLYTILHEGGHAAVAMANGATVDAFTVGSDAHVAWSGGTWTAATTATQAAAGVVLPALVTVGVLVAYRRHVRRIAYHVLHVTWVVAVAFSTLPWIAIPVMSLVGVAPPDGDDVTKAIDAVPSAWIVAASAVVALTGLCALATARGLPQTWLRIVRELRSAGRPTTSEGPPPPP